MKLIVNHGIYILIKWHVFIIHEKIVKKCLSFKWEVSLQIHNFRKIGKFG